VLGLLREHFVSGWSLVADLNELVNATSSDDDDIHAKAKTVLDTYAFPVMSYVMHANGTIVHRINANHLLDLSRQQGQERNNNLASGGDDEDNEHSQAHSDHHPVSLVYEKFLRDALSKATVSSA